MSPETLTVEQIDRRLALAIEQRRSAVRTPNPTSAATVGRCDETIDRLLEQRYALTEAS